MKTIITLFKLWQAKQDLEAQRTRARKETIESAKKALIEMGLVKA